MLDKISAICSIAGFVISIATFVYAIFIEKRVREFEKGVLFNTRIPLLIKNLKSHNSQLAKNLEEKSERNIRESLNLCSTSVETICTKLPADLMLLCVEVNKKLKDQYKSNLIFDNSKTTTWKFWIKTSTVDDLWVSYDNLTSLIIHIEEKLSSKKIIR